MYERILVGTDGSPTAAMAVDRAVEVSGDPASVLVEVAEQDGYDLLVVGNRGMTGASRFLLGSVPNKVSPHTGVALLIVHTT